MPRRVVLDGYDSEDQDDVRKLNKDVRDSHIYLNLTVFNNNTSYDKQGNPMPTEQGVQCSLTQSQAAAYVKKPKDYDMSVVQFNLDSNSFPVQIAQSKVGSTYQLPISSTNYTVEGFPTIFALKIITQAGEVTVPVYWKTSDYRLEPPPSPLAEINIYNEYFWNYSYEYFILLINKSLFYAIDILVPGHLEMPYFKYENGFFTFNAPLSFRTDPITGDYYDVSIVPSFKIELNEPLYNLLSGLQSLYTNFNTYQLLVFPNADTSNIISQYDSLLAGATSTNNYIKMTQNYKSALLWNPVTSVVFITPVIPVVDEMISRPYVFGMNPVPVTNNAGLSNTLFELSLGRRADPQINYFPKAQYFLTSLLGRQDLSEIQFQTFWRDDLNQLHPFYVEAGSTFNIKIMFRKKLFNS
jgi:hypothetical protein